MYPDYGEEPQLPTRTRNKAVIQVSEDPGENLNSGQEPEINLSLSEKILMESAKKETPEEVCIRNVFKYDKKNMMKNLCR